MVDREKVANIPLLCECGHAARGHGPRLGEDFHTRCWFCQCDVFVKLTIDADVDEIVNTARVAEELRVSTDWVRHKAPHLGGDRHPTSRHWRFILATAVHWGQRMIMLSGRRPTIYQECELCGTRQLMQRGTLGTEVVSARHLPGMCPTGRSGTSSESRRRG